MSEYDTASTSGRSGRSPAEGAERSAEEDADTGGVARASEWSRVHLVGIGGAGMSAIAHLLLERGIATSGSDGKDSAVLQALAAAGATTYVGHAAAQIPDGATVVVSTAVRADNPELVAAREAGLPVLHRSEALAALMATGRGIAIAGTHGKTTTTGMLTVLLREAGLDPSFAIGGQLTDSGLGAHAGSGDVFVVEADESDGSFVHYHPEIAVITNVEADHLDHHGSAQGVEDAFVAFTATIRGGGLLVACGDDPGVQRVLARAEADLAARGVEIRRYGFGGPLDVRIVDVVENRDGVSFALDHDGVRTGPVQLDVLGRHNALNATATWVVAVHLGVRPGSALQSLASFAGTRRRFELVGEAGGVEVYDDYAHHPTEVRAVLQAARARTGQGRLIAVFQPHLPSRTRALAGDFAAALALADEVLVLDVYLAREDPDPEVSGALISDQVAGGAQYHPDQATVPAAVAAIARPGDTVLTIGAGDVTALGRPILDAVSEYDAASASGASRRSPAEGPERSGSEDTDTSGVARANN